MPILTTRIQGVTWHYCRIGAGQRKKKYDVLIAGRNSVETWDPLKASLCERAAIQGFEVRLGLKDSRHGEEIVSVDRVESSVSRAGRI